MDNETGVKPIQIKGIREGLLVTLGEGSWPELRKALLAQIEQQSSFYKGARLALDVGPLVIHAAELGSLRDALSERGVSLWAVMSRSGTTEQTAQVLGLATRLSAPRPERVIRPMDTHISGDDAILLQRTLRSGFKAEHPGHIIVIGDVNPGAEIVAGGSVVVWGKLRGSVQAGSNGDETAEVCALDMDPTHLRIAEVIASPQKRKGKPAPVAARLVNGEIITEIWNPKGK